MAAFLDPGAWGRELARETETYEAMADPWIAGEDMPQEANRIMLRGDVDRHGMPVADVFADHPNDAAMRERAHTRGERIHEAAGAREAFRVPP